MDDINRLVLELNSSVQSEAPAQRGDTSRLEAWLRLLVARGGESLTRLVRDGLVEWREAQTRAVHVEEFEQLCPNRSQ